jgi:hypothetical protein
MLLPPPLPDAELNDAQARAAEIAADPDAPRWAQECAWVPGTGYCRNRPCSPQCVFRIQRGREASQITHARRRRRRPPRLPAGWTARSIAVLLVLAPLFGFGYA